MDHVPALAAGPARGWAELALSRRVAGRPVCPACRVAHAVYWSAGKVVYGQKGPAISAVINKYSSHFSAAPTAEEQPVLVYKTRKW